jgi:hypothetical protein
MCADISCCMSITPGPAHFAGEATALVAIIEKIVFL